MLISNNKTIIVYVDPDVTFMFNLQINYSDYMNLLILKILQTKEVTIMHYIRVTGFIEYKGWESQTFTLGSIEK